VCATSVDRILDANYTSRKVSGYVRRKLGVPTPLHFLVQDPSAVK